MISCIIDRFYCDCVFKQSFSETKLMENFPPHSCQSASTIKALDMNLDISEILNKVCWNNVETFSEQYKK